VEDFDAFFGDGSSCEFRITGMSDFADDKDFEWSFEGAGDFGGDGDTSTGESEDDCEAIDTEGADFFGEFFAGFAAVGKHRGQFLRSELVGCAARGMLLWWP
jgi:hypothetical protein